MSIRNLAICIAVSTSCLTCPLRMTSLALLSSLIPRKTGCPSRSSRVHSVNLTSQSSTVLPKRTASFRRRLTPDQGRAGCRKIIKWAVFDGDLVQLRRKEFQEFSLTCTDPTSKLELSIFINADQQRAPNASVRQRVAYSRNKVLVFQSLLRLRHSLL
jgi:hypothetical protein